MICTNCYYKGRPDEKMKGNFLTEVLLWFFFLIPGIIYTIWRHTTKAKVCASCEQPTLVPEDSIRGKEIIKKHLKSKSSEEIIEKLQAKVNTKKSNKRFKIVIGIVVVFLTIGFIANLADESAEQSKDSKPTPTPISEEYKEQLAQTFCEERSGDYVRSINLNDFLLMYEKAGETVTLRPETGKPSEENCKKVVDLCLSTWDKDECEGIAERKIWVGMEKDQLYLSWGLPNDTNDSVGRWGRHSQWVYGLGSYVYLEGESQYDMTVTSWQQ